MFDSIIYERRRQALRDKVQSGIILLLGNNEAPANYPDNCYHYRQDSTFLYFFGQSHPGYAGVLDIEAGEDIFFGNDVDIDDIIWMGPQPSIKELAAQVGVQKTMPLTQLWEVVAKAIEVQVPRTVNEAMGKTRSRIAAVYADILRSSEERQAAWLREQNQALEAAQQSSQDAPQAPAADMLQRLQSLRQAIQTAMA